MIKSFSKKIFFSLTFLVVIGAAFCFRKKILATAIGYCALLAASFCGKELSFASIDYDKGQVTFEKLCLSHKEHPVLKAQSLHIHLYLAGSSLKVEGKLGVEHPEIYVDPQDSSQELSWNALEKWLRSFRFLKNISVDHGSLLIKESAAWQKYPFSFQIFAHNDLLNLDLQIPSVPASVFSKSLPISETLFPYALVSGSIAGNLTMQCSTTGQVLFLDSSMIGHQVIVEKSQEKLRACLGEVLLTTAYQQHKTNSLFIKDILTGKNLEGIHPSISIRDSSLFMSDAQGKLLWKAENVDVFASLAQQGIPEVAASGHIIKGSMALPFSFQGKGVFQGFDSWDLDLLNSAEIPLDLKRCKRIGVKKKGPQEFLIALDVDDIDELDIQMMQELLDPILPELSSIKLHKGKLKADLNCCIKQGFIEYLECKELVFKEGLIEDKQRGLSVHLARLEASAWIEAPFSSSFKLHQWELHFSSVSIQHPYHPDALNVEGQVFCEKGLHLSMSLKIHCAGASIVCESYGSLEKQDIKMQLIPGANPWFSSLQQRVSLRDSKAQTLKKVFIDCSLAKHNQQLSLQGSTFLEFHQGCQDEVEFKTISNLQGPLFEALKSSKVFLSSNKVSCHTYLLILEPFALKWFVTGDMQVKGVLDRHDFTFETWAAQAVYDSEDILVTLPLKEDPYYGKFHFSWKERSWNIFLPLKQALCEDKKLHLPFTQVYTDVYIQGTDLFAKNLTAFCENVFFSGQIHIDFKDPSWVDLKLYPNQMEGGVKDFLKFLSHIVDPHLLSNLPALDGKVKGAPDNFFCLKYNLTQIHKKAKVALEIQELEAPITDTCRLAKGGCSLLWDIDANILEIKDGVSKLLIAEQEGERIYELKLPELSCRNLEQSMWNFDLRLETSTLDLARLSGRIFPREDAYVIDMQNPHNHFFGNLLDSFHIEFASNSSLSSLQTKVKISDQGFFSCADFLKKINCLNAKFAWLEMLPTSARWKEATLEVVKQPQQPLYQLKIQAESFTAFDQGSYLLNIDASYTDDKSFKAQLLYGDFQAFCHLEKHQDLWSIQSLEAKSLDGYIHACQGSLSPVSIDIHFATFAWDLQRLALASQRLFAKQVLENRVIRGSLDMKLLLPSSLKSFKIEGVFKGSSDSKSDTDLTFKTIKPLVFSYSHQMGLHIDQLDLQVFQQNTSLQCSSIQFEKATFNNIKDFSIRGAKLSINPEMLHYLVSRYPTPFSSTSGERLKISNLEFIWDNHLETQLDFLADGQAFQVQGVLKEGYYWIGKESIYLQKVYYFLDQGHCNVVFGVDYKDVSLDVLAKLQFKEDVDVHLSIKPFHEESAHDERKSLEIFCKYERQEGFYVQACEGELFGVQCSFRKNPRAYAPHILLLTGHLKCHPAKLASYFKNRKMEFLKEMGSGYELSGDLFVCKNDLLSSHFKGYFKGRDFHFCDFYFKTLMSEVDCNLNHINIHDLSLSDLSGVLKIKEIKIFKDEERWKMKIPEVVLQDFRPSFLRKSLSEDEKIKPLIIKHLHMFNLEGTLGNIETFKGRGYLDFINTFKREMHILDIPIEIIGRIGFDLGIFIPVMGKLEFEMQKGKVLLKELKNTFSEGRRSRFYLSGYKDSYIGLDGELAIDIKMKQYVLLKFTEPFTLSIRGSVSKPRYSLR